MKNKFCYVILGMFLSSSFGFAYSVGSLYDCPSMMLFSPERYSYQKVCKEASRYGMSPEKCKQYYVENYGKTLLEYKQGQCKMSKLKYIEGNYNSSSCSINFEIHPVPKIMGYGHSGSEGPKCTDILYKELKKRFPNITK